MSEKANIEPHGVAVDGKFQIKIAEGGPYLVFGRPPLAQQFLMPDENGEIWCFQQGRSFETDADPTALCRCGESQNKPYCDGSHKNASWDPALTASDEPLLSEAEILKGPELSLSDNRNYCVFARFCDAKGRIWNTVERSDDKRYYDITVHEAQHCPGARLSTWDNKTGKSLEAELEPELGLIEDPQINVSGGIWVTGGIPVRNDTGFTYEIRNRVVLCRCGQSRNKPYCDGTHASAGFKDGIDAHPDGKKW